MTTPLDEAHAAMDAAPDDDLARLRFFERLAGSELALLLAAEPEGDRIEPALFDTEDGRFVLVFDREDRLTDFTGAPSPTALVSGRNVAELLAGQGIGLGVNLGVAPSSILLPSEAVDWLARTLAHRPSEANGTPKELRAPSGLPEPLITSIDARLARAEGLADMAYLVAVTYEDGRRGHLLAFVDAIPDAEPSLARAIGEALVFTGLDMGELDIAFLRASDPVAARLARVGLRFDLPEAPKATVPAAPGMDPDAPPRLR